MQAYYDRTVRDERNTSETRDTFDLDVQNRMTLSANYEMTFGGGYRLTRGDTEGVPTVTFIPRARTDQLVSAFFEGDVALQPGTTHFIFGSKFEVNDYSGFEWQPNVRLSFAPNDQSMYWLSAARAVRMPSRLEQDLTLVQLADPATPAFLRLTGNQDFNSEKIIAYEAGHRRQLRSDTSLELSLFSNHYRDFISAEAGAPFIEPLPNGTNALFIPYLFGNGMRVDTRGGEATLHWLPVKNLRISGQYAYLYVTAHPAGGSTDTISESSVEKGSPRHTAVLRLSWDPLRAVNWDMDLRYVSERPAMLAPEYLTADARLSYWFTPHLEVEWVGRDLFTPYHPEFFAGPTGVQVSRSVYTSVKWYW